ncbi:hypothetical protein RCO48_17755 [Peribacillus frigoritolerans]|nr:hypothetical protein [Peribacillus frigoritolerans]
MFEELDFHDHAKVLFVGVGTGGRFGVDQKPKDERLSLPKKASEADHSISRNGYWLEV